MKKILIVDDQTLNQTLLEAYLNQYGETSGEEMEIFFANNGIEAVIRAQEHPFDLIFMDIIMPTMDGIEATKQIHHILPNAIIVIVSTEGDEENQIKALRNGAKDYCIKPIQPDVFKHRLQLYMNMMNREKSITAIKQSTNPFTKNIFCYKTTYLIENEEDLAQLWESLLLKIKDSVRTNCLSDLIRFMYQLGIVMLSRKVQPQIIMEENESHIFFCVINVNIIPSVKIVQLIENYLTNVHYDLKSNLLSFKMNKEYLPPQKIVEPLASEPISTIAYEKEAEILHVFDFMEYDDLTSLELKLNELSTQFMWMGNNELNMEDVDQIVNAFERSSSILLLYTQTQILGIAIRDLTEVIKKDEKKFISMAAQMSTLCKGFNNDLILWLRSLFYDGAPSVNFMDASIMSNIQMIRSFLEPDPEVTLDDTDGFEFF
jgi:CheY-like chemotaxis protein